ncbi:MAG: ISAs1 family transposase [Treponema sp.]|nr:ISAs1 family transposase [Treponema sp.]
MSASLYGWLEETREGGEREINIDGKTIRGSGDGERRAVHVVSAWVGEEEIVLGQLAVEEKSNEIRAIPKLLDLFEVKGSTITIDAMGCQREIAEKIGKEQGDYVLAVKENQPVLYQEVKEYFEGLESGEIGELPEDLWITEEERGHGRREKREVRTVTDIGWFEGKKDGKDLQTIIQNRSFRTVQGETSQGDRYYISNADKSAEWFYGIIRGHWSIENKLHWSLDVIFGEDAARASKEHAPENLNIFEENGAFPVTGGPNSPAGGKEKDNRSQKEIYRFHEPGLYVHRPVRKVNARTSSRIFNNLSRIFFAIPGLITDQHGLLL